MAILVIGIGLILGSFLSVLIARWPHWRGVVAGRSACPACGHVLSGRDLIPLVSWLLSRGRCRHCSAPVSAWYPLYEGVMAAVLYAYAMSVGLTGWVGGIELAILAVLVALFFFDLRHYMLPDVLVAVLAVLGILRHVILGAGLLNAAAIGAGVAACLLLILLFWQYVLKRDGMGYGDIKLAVALGLVLGFPVMLYATVAAVWAGALVGIVLMSVRRAGLRTELPFGCFWTVTAAAFLLMPWLARILNSMFLPY